MSRSEVCYQRCPAKADLIAIAQNAVHRARLDSSATGTNRVCITCHHHNTGVSQCLDRPMAGGMVAVCVTGKKDLDVLHLEAQLLHASLKQRHSALEVAVNEDMPAGCHNEVFSQISRAHVEHIADDA